ncbi:hypothetical protein DESC_720092 [Desulfosarcina cetonica]|nr:hypothetical protein DESC_720092 [Desulfosarcina cetonica]
MFSQASPSMAMVHSPISLTRAVRRPSGEKRRCQILSNTVSPQASPFTQTVNSPSSTFTTAATFSPSGLAYGSSTQRYSVFQASRGIFFSRVSQSQLWGSAILPPLQYTNAWISGLKNNSGFYTDLASKPQGRFWAHAQKWGAALYAAVTDWKGCRGKPGYQGHPRCQPGYEKWAGKMFHGRGTDGLERDRKQDALKRLPIGRNCDFEPVFHG